MKENLYKDDIIYRGYRSTFWGGFGSLFNVAGNLRHRSYTDIDHQRAAWVLVGKCMWSAMEQFEEETDIRVLEDYRHLPELASHDG